MSLKFEPGYQLVFLASQANKSQINVLVEDTYWHKGMRRKLIEELRSQGIRDEKVLKAMGMLPRHFFLDKAFEEKAYENKAFPIGNEQTISQPYTVAYQTALLEVKKRQRILEIGTGSGYQAAILAMLGARVYTVERQEVLFERAKGLLQQLQVGNVRCFLRDGFKGLPEFAPFDKILVTCGAKEVPQSLLQQLKVGGWLVIPVGKEVQRMQRITRAGEQQFTRETFDDFRFVPFLRGINKQ
jgi:protein-L-isoaspartate(D-aspartate) O-methyltransferase